MWFWCIPYFLKNLLERTRAQGTIADIYAGGIPFVLLTMNAHTLLLLMSDRIQYEAIFQAAMRAKLLWALTLAAGIYICRRGVGWMSAIVSDDEVERDKWYRRGRAALLGYLVVTIAATAIGIVKSRWADARAATSECAPSGSPQRDRPPSPPPA
jgi:hypothetical protein